MKVSVMLVLWLLLGTTLMMLLSSGCSTTCLSSSDMVSDSSSVMIIAARGRKLESDSKPSTDDNIGGAHGVHLEDYRPIDPSPSSKTSIRPAPVQHGSPLNPYIPKLPPPPPHTVSDPKIGGSS